jgi:hypothetical protein
MGNVWFGESGTILIRKPNPVVSHPDFDLVIDLLNHYRNHMSALPRRHRISGILEKIRQGLPYHAAITLQNRTLFRNRYVPLDPRPRGFLEDQRFTHDSPDIIRLDHGLRHSRERRKLVDHSADISNMANDRVGT